MVEITRVEQPTLDSCFATSIAMLTGIDVDLLPLDRVLAPSIYFKYKDGEVTVDAVSSREFDTWKRLLEELGYETKMHKTFPHEPCLVNLVFYDEDNFFSGHTVVADDDGRFIDPSPYQTFADIRVIDIINSCNVVIPKYGYITIKPATRRRGITGRITSWLRL